MEPKQTLDPEILISRYFDRPSDDLKDMILLQFSSTVERTARKFSGVEAFEDLVQVGYIGLLNALKKFDPTAGVKFSTYATHLIAGEIKHFLRDKSQIIRHPAWLQELRHKVGRANVKLQAELGRTPTNDEIAKEAGVTLSSIDEVLSTADSLRVSSYDATPAGDDDSNELEQLTAFCPDQLSVEERVVLETAMMQLRDLERDVLIMFHFESKSQTEIAEDLGISCNYVSHILRQTLSKLRRILTAEETSDRKLQKQNNSEEEGVIDPFIGTYSEKYFNDRLSEEVHRCAAIEGAVAIAFVKFENIKSLETYYGKDSVVDFLIDASEFCRDLVRRLDVVCAMGRDGFSIILPFTGPTASIVNERLNTRFEPWLNQRRGPAGDINVKTGYAVYSEESNTPAKMIEMANLMLSGACVVNLERAA